MLVVRRLPVLLLARRRRRSVASVRRVGRLARGRCAGRVPLLLLLVMLRVAVRLAGSRVHRARRAGRRRRGRALVDASGTELCNAERPAQKEQRTSARVSIRVGAAADVVANELGGGLKASRVKRDVASAARRRQTRSRDLSSI